MTVIISVLIALMLFGFGVYSRNYQSKTPSPTDFDNVYTDTATPINTPEETVTQQPDPTSIPQPTPSTAASYETDFFYPQATVISTNDGITTLSTTDDADRVYSYYKQKIENGGFHSKNFVRTRANNQFKAVLTGDDTHITIEQQNLNEPVHIQIQE